MKSSPLTVKVAALLMVGYVLTAVGAQDAVGPGPSAKNVLNSAEVTGGLVVHLDCGDGRFTAELGAKGPYLVRGLEKNAEKVRKAREHIASRGLYGEVSVAHWRREGLPFSDNLVDMLICQGEPSVPRDELMRVLSPGGVLCVKKSNHWNTDTKPWPDKIDEWSHFLHDSSNNAVAEDTRVGPPKALQWKAPPRWARSHEFPSNVHGVVSANGRLFANIDQGIIGQPRGVPARWTLVARDAFNGVLLWKRPASRIGRRRLVASEDKVYVTLNGGDAVSILDAATGEKVGTCEGTENTRGIVISNGIVLCRGENSKKQRRSGEKAQFVVAADANTGELIWKQTENNVRSRSLAALDGRVCYQTGDQLVCRDLLTGECRWRTSCGGTSYTIMHKDVVLCSGRGGTKAFSVETGESLWSGPPRARSVPGVFVAKGLVWASWPPGTPYRGRTFTWQPRKTVRKGYAPKTGEVQRKVSVERLVSPGHHIRCYPPKATERYLLLNKRGVEFLDLQGNSSMRHNWFRGSCAYGVMPANGLLYVPPDECFCYRGVQLSGFNALSAQAGQTADAGEGISLQHGAAWGEVETDDSSAKDWPTYRHDPRRSGSVDYELPVHPEPGWRTDLKGDISPPVAADGKIFVANSDAHAVQCLDAETGKKLWTYRTGARVDSPPTIHEGLVIFGSRDGCVYCLRASDGELVWRFRAAPDHRQIVVRGQLESAWPSHGSVLVRDGKVYCTAGRNSYLDGGVYVYALDPRTGEVIHSKHLSNDPPDVSEEAGRPFDMDGASSDLLVAGRQDIYMFKKRFNEDLSLETMPRITKLGDRRAEMHVMTNDGFLDKTWFNRTFWTYSTRWPGYYLAPDAPKSGQLLVFDDTHTYGVKVYREWHGLSPEFKPGSGYRLFADPNSNEPTLNPTAIGREKGAGFSRKQPPAWSKKVPVRVEAMVLAGDRLYVAGPPDLPSGEEAEAAMRGKRGARFRVISAKDGARLAGFELESAPVFDGMIAAYNRLYMVTRDGGIMSFRPDKTPPQIETIRAFNAEQGEVLVNFNERVTPESAKDRSRYRINAGVEVRSVELRNGGRTVELTTSLLKNGVSYTLTIKGVEDRSRGANATSTSTEFTCRQPQPGLMRRYYEGKWQNMPDFDSMEPVKTEIVKEIGAIGPRSKHHFGLQFEGYLRVPEGGAYTFHLSSDDGSRLYLDNSLSRLFHKLGVCA